MDAHNLRDAKDKIQDASVDAVFSSASLHWMKADPKKVLEGTYRVLKSGGRFAGEVNSFALLSLRPSLLAEGLDTPSTFAARCASLYKRD